MHAGIWGGGISGFLHTPPAGSIVLVWQLCAATPNALNPCTSPFTHPGTLKPAEPPPPHTGAREPRTWARSSPAGALSTKKLRTHRIAAHRITGRMPLPSTAAQPQALALDSFELQGIVGFGFRVKRVGTSSLDVMVLQARSGPRVLRANVSFLQLFLGAPASTASCADLRHVCHAYRDLAHPLQRLPQLRLGLPKIRENRIPQPLPYLWAWGLLRC